VKNYGCREEDLPSLATVDGVRFSKNDAGVGVICHPCHWFEESIVKDLSTKRFLQLAGKGGNLPVQGVLGKTGSTSPRPPYPRAYRCLKNDLHPTHF